MNIDKKWEVLNLNIQPVVGTNTNVVTLVQWQVTYTNDIGHACSIVENVYLSLPSETEFSDFSTLTEEQVIGWVKATLSEQALVNIDTALTLDVLKQTTPIQFLDESELPWASAPTNTGV